MPAHCLWSMGFSLSLKDAQEHYLFGRVRITPCSFCQVPPYCGIGTSLASRERPRHRSPWSPWSPKDMFPLISASKRLKFQQFRVLSPTAASKWWEQEFPGNHCDQELGVLLPPLMASQTCSGAKEGGGYCDLPGKVWWFAGEDTLSGALRENKL